MNKQRKRSVLLTTIVVIAAILAAMILYLIRWEHKDAAAVIGPLEEIESAPGNPAEQDTFEPEMSISPDLDAVFESFRGNWVIDRSRGAVIYVGRYAGSGWDMHPEIFPDGVPVWILSITGGDMLTDRHVVSWTGDSISFFHNGFCSCLRHVESGGIEYSYGYSSDKPEGIIKAEERTAAD